MLVHQIPQRPGKGITRRRSTSPPQWLVAPTRASPIATTAGITGTTNIIPASIGAPGAQIGSGAPTRRTAPTLPPAEAAKDVADAGAQRSDGSGGIDPPHAATAKDAASPSSHAPVCRPILLLDLGRREQPGWVDVDAPIGGNVDALVEDVPLLGRSGTSDGGLALVGFLVQSLGVGLDDGGDDGGGFVKGRRPVQGQPSWFVDRITQHMMSIVVRERKDKIRNIYQCTSITRITAPQLKIVNLNLNFDSPYASKHRAPRG